MNSMLSAMKVCGALLLIPVMIYAKYRAVKAREAVKDQRADVQTLFEGRK